METLNGRELQKHDKRPLGDISVSNMSYQGIMFGMKPDCKTWKIKFTVVHIDTPQKYGQVWYFTAASANIKALSWLLSNNVLPLIIVHSTWTDLRGMVQSDG